MDRAGVHPMPDFPVGIRNGLISGEHRRRMGMAVWEFMWLVDHVTEEYQRPDGECRGRVLGGTVIKADTIADEMEISANTVQDSLKKLFIAGYIDYRRDAYGYRIEVRNSKKWVRPPTGVTDYGPYRTGEREFRRTGDSSISPELHKSDSPAPLDIAMGEDLTESHPDDDDDKAASVWTAVVEVVTRERSARVADAVRACQPGSVNGNDITVILPSDSEQRDVLSRFAHEIRIMARQVSGRPLNVRFLDPPAP